MNSFNGTAIVLAPAALLQYNSTKACTTLYFGAKYYIPNGKTAQGGGEP
jgi:hypothetical protein